MLAIQLTRAVQPVPNVIVENATKILSQDIAAGVHNQTLGEYTVETTNAAISVPQTEFTIQQFTRIITTGTNIIVWGTTNAITNINISELWILQNTTNAITDAVIVNENNVVVSGPPVDSKRGASGYEEILSFTNRIDYPKGKHTYAVIGKPSLMFSNNTLVALTTNPAKDWRNAIWVTYLGPRIVLEDRAVWMGNMTVKTPPKLELFIDNSGITGYSKGTLILRVRGQKNQFYHVERSIDLINWSSDSGVGSNSGISLSALRHLGGPQAGFEFFRIKTENSVTNVVAHAQ